MSATWTPGTGVPTPLVEGGEVEFDTALSRGVVTLVAEYPGVVADPVVAFALEYGQGRFAEAGRDRYFPVDAGLIQSVRTGPNTVVTAYIPMLSFPTLMPDTLGETGQTLRVWVGRASGMVVDSRHGVTAADDQTAYTISTRIPSLTIRKDLRAFQIGSTNGLFETSMVRLRVYRFPAQADDEVFTLTAAGPPGVLESLVLPATLTIPQHRTSREIEFEFNPFLTDSWPGESSDVTVSATGPSGTTSTTLSFEGFVRMEAFTSVLLFRDTEDRRCKRHTTVAFGTGTPTPIYGDCVPAGVAVAAGAAAGPGAGIPGGLQFLGECPTLRPNGSLSLVVTPYACEDNPTTNCEIAPKTFSTPSAFVVVLTAAACTITTITTPFGTVIGEDLPPALIPPNAPPVITVVTVPGFRCCYNEVATGAPGSITAPDCETIG